MTRLAFALALLLAACGPHKPDQCQRDLKEARQRLDVCEMCRRTEMPLVHVCWDEETETYVPAEWSERGPSCERELRVCNAALQTCADQCWDLKELEEAELLQEDRDE